MGVSDRLKMKSAAILADTRLAQVSPGSQKNDGAGADEPSPAVHQSTVTAPGGMAVFRQHLVKHEATVKALEDELSQFKEGIKTLSLDPSLIDPSKWANRHKTSFESKSFEELKEEIAHAGRNVQPILIRPCASALGRYEVVFGHRRWAACRQLGINVVAMVMDLSDQELFTFMDRENRNREDLTPFEQGVMWAKAIDEGLFSSERKLALDVGVSPVYLGQCLKIARLPEYVIGLFNAPTEIQVRWAKALQDRLQADPEAVAERASQIKVIGHALPSSKVFEMLMGEAKDVPPKSIPVKHEGRVVGKISRASDGGVSLTLRSGAMSAAAFQELQEAVSKLIGS